MQVAPGFMRSIARSYIIKHRTETFVEAQRWLKEAIIKTDDEQQYADFIAELKPYIIEEGNKQHDR